MNMLTRNKRFFYKNRIVKQKNPKVLKKLAIAFAIVAVAATLYLRFLQPHTLEVKQRIKLESTVQQLKTTEKQLKTQEVKSQEENDKRNAEIQQLQAKANGQKVYAASLDSATGYPAPSNWAKANLYAKESGNNPNARNYLGCYGLGQDCNHLVEAQCGADYACQDAFFTDYMQRRYGSWENAWAFWQARVPINGKDVGNWW